MHEVDMKDVESAVEAAYAKGIADGVAAFAWWKDGVQYVGTGGRKLDDVLKDVTELAGFAPPKVEVDKDRFGEVFWSNADIKTAAENQEVELTDDEVDEVLGNINEEHLTECMVEAGWSVIEDAVSDFVAERDEQKGTKTA